ncbi:MAG: hypothetical protein WA705_30065 [Candidatus Ozemobacteraceae bacterium]
MFSYSAYGLYIQSALQLPELLPVVDEAAEVGTVDVEIRYGVVPVSIPSPVSEGMRHQASPGCFLLTVDQVARYYVSNGREICIEPISNAIESDIRVFLLESVFAALLHQRKILPLHASGVVIDGNAVLFCGGSAVGKSTLAAAFFRNGFPILADQFCAVQIDSSGRPVVIPGFPRLLLWADAIGRLGMNRFKSSPIRSGILKYGLDVRETFAKKLVPVGRFFFVETGISSFSEFSIISGSEGLEALIQSTYCFRFLNGLGGKSEHFRNCLQIAKTVPLAVFKKGGDPFSCMRDILKFVREEC